MLVIHPDECIDCGLCEPECPVKAIAHEDELPPDQLDFIQINEELSECWPNIYQIQDALPDADHWKDVKEKRHLLEK